MPVLVDGCCKSFVFVWKRSYDGENVLFLCVLFVRITSDCGCVRAFFMFLIMRCSGYARASKMQVKLLSSSWSMMSSEHVV